MVAIKILFLAANPDNTSRLRLDEEHREISNKIRISTHPNSLRLISGLAVRPDDLQQLLLQHQPHILHLSGHGSPSGEIILHDNENNPKPVTLEALEALCRALKDNIRLVFLNACNSRFQAEALVDTIDYAIGMKATIDDAAAITFASSFYRAIGFGRSIQTAFDLGVTALGLEGIPEANIPVLLVRSGANASEVLLRPPVRERDPNFPVRVARTHSETAPTQVTRPTGDVELRIKLARTDYNERVRDFLINGVAEFLDIAPNDIEIVRIEDGSVKVTLRLPKHLAEELQSAYYNGDAGLFRQLFPLPLADLRDAPLKARVLAAGSREWLLSTSDLWCNFVIVLCFAKLVHHTFQVVDTMHTTDLASGVSELLGAQRSVALSKQLAFQQAWRQYDQHYHELQDESSQLFSENYIEVEEALKTLQAEQAPRINKRILKCKDYFGAIKEELDEYARSHREAHQVASNAQSLLATFRDPKAATQFYGHLAQLSKTAKDLAVNADALLKLLIDAILER